MQFGHKRPTHTEHPPTTDSLDAWIVELAAALSIDSTTIDRDLILGVSRATHPVARAAAPLTIFLVGMAAGLNGGGTEAVNQAAETAQRLANTHTAQAE